MQNPQVEKAVRGRLCKKIIKWFHKIKCKKKRIVVLDLFCIPRAYFYCDIIVMWVSKENGKWFWNNAGYDYRIWEPTSVFPLCLQFFQSAAAKSPRKSSTTTPIGSLSLDSANESKRGNLRPSSWVSFCEKEKWKVKTSFLTPINSETLFVT